MMFMLLTIALAVIAVLFLLLPLFSRKTRQTAVERDAVNVEVAAAHLSELKQELETGQITEQQFQHYRLELETVALEDLRKSAPENESKQSGNTVVAIVIALLVPLLSLSVYHQIGNEAAVSGEVSGLDTNGAHSKAELENMVADLEKDIAENPDDAEKLFTLGQVYSELGRQTEAAKVYQRLYQLRPEDPEVIFYYAEALAHSHGNRLTGKPTELLNKALSIAPDYGQALWLAGLAAMQASDREQALVHWRRLLIGQEPGSEAYLQIEKLVNELQSGDSSSDSSAVAQADNTLPTITVNVSLAAGLQASVDPDASLFVFARAAKGPPMPLAVYKGQAKDLPVTVVLDDSMAMMPGMSLSHFPKVIVGARLSSNGQAQGQSGDEEGFSDVLEPSTSPVIDLIIDKIKP